MHPPWEGQGALGLAAAASFKHVSPAGAAVYAPIDDELLSVYEVTDGGGWVAD